QYLFATGRPSHALQQLARQDPPHTVHVRLHLFYTKLSQEPVDVGVRREKRSQDGGAAGRERPTCPPNMQSMCRRCETCIALPLCLRTNLMARETGFDQTQVALSGSVRM